MEKGMSDQENRNFKTVVIWLLVGIITLLSIPVLGIFAFFTPPITFLILAYILPKDKE